jgi:hypothetical protein
MSPAIKHTAIILSVIAVAGFYIIPKVNTASTPTKSLVGTSIPTSVATTEPTSTAASNPTSLASADPAPEDPIKDLANNIPTSEPVAVLEEVKKPDPAGVGDTDTNADPEPDPLDPPDNTADNTAKTDQPVISPECQKALDAGQSCVISSQTATVEPTAAEKAAFEKKLNEKATAMATAIAKKEIDNLTSQLGTAKKTNETLTKENNKLKETNKDLTASNKDLVSQLTALKNAPRYCVLHTKQRVQFFDDAGQLQVREVTEQKIVKCAAAPAGAAPKK